MSACVIVGAGVGHITTLSEVSGTSGGQLISLSRLRVVSGSGEVRLCLYKDGPSEHPVTGVYYLVASLCLSGRVTGGRE